VAIAYLETARSRLGLSVRGVIRVARVARTVASLDRSASVTAVQVAEALSFRLEAWTHDLPNGGPP
jgi:predicted ATPase with chaperone activity